MKIGFDAKRAFNNSRGLGNYSRDTIRILSSLYPENEYFLFTPKTDSHIGYKYPEKAKVVTPNKMTIKSFWRTFGITKEAMAENIEVYHGLSHELPVGIEKTKIHTVVTMHDLIFMTHPELYSSWDRWMYKKKYLHSCEVADKVIAISERTKKDLIEVGGIDSGKIEVVYQGCNPIFWGGVDENQLEAIKVKYSLPNSYILSVGAIEPRKNHKLIIEALANGHIDMPFVIIGQKTGYQEQLAALIHKFGLDNKVLIINHIIKEELPLIYRGASLFVFPSLYEGFGIPVIEALCSGIPVIASTGSCLEEAGGPNSCYVSPTDSSELAFQIQRLLDDDALRSKMAASGLQYVEQFNDRVIGEKLIRNYNSKRTSL